MKRIGVFETQKNLPSILKELPVEITRYGKVVAILSPPGIKKEELGVPTPTIPTKTKRPVFNTYREEMIKQREGI